MGEHAERSVGKDLDGNEVGFRVSKSDEGSTRTFHGYEGKDNPHTTEHSDGSWWKTDSEGEKSKTVSSKDSKEGVSSKESKNTSSRDDSGK